MTPARESLNKIFTRLLWGQFYLPILIIALGAIGAAAYLGGQSFLSQQVQIASAMTYSVTEYVKNASDVLETMAAQADFADYHDFSLSLDLLRRGQHSFEAFYLLDSKGIVKVMVPEDASYLELDWSSQHFFKDTTQVSSVVISKPFISLRSNQPAVILSIRMVNGGVLAGELNLAELQRITNSSTRTDLHRTEFFVTDEAGTLLAYPDFQRVARQENLNSLAVVKEARQSGRSYRTYLLDGTIYQGQAIRIANNWIIVAQTPLEAIYYPYYGTALLMLLFSVLALAFFIRRIYTRFNQLLVEPLHQLRTFTGQLAAGQFSAERQLQNIPNTFEELGQLVGDFSQMSEAVQKRTEDLEHLARIDRLTGLSNRAYFRDQVSQLIEQSRANQSHFALLFVDLDDFKSVNDAFGHLSGDKVLCRIANVINQPQPDRLLAGRLGGDEFALVQRMRYTHDAAGLAEKLLGELNQPMQIDNHLVYISPSIGISFFPEDGSSPDMLIQKADTAMNFAKREGKNGYQIYSLEMETQAQERHAYTTHLHHALDFNELSLVYQPLVRTITRRRAGFEALLRWKNPRLGQVPPDKFIPLANDSGLILPIGEWILRSACLQALNWSEAGSPVGVSVNISERQLKYKGFTPSLMKILAETGLPPQQLCLELTESIVFQNFKEINLVLNQVKRLGVRLSLDDFGTGYSTLSCLTQIPFDEIKIDRSLSGLVIHSPREGAIVSGILRIAKDLGMQVVAEGIETEAQIEYFARLDCDLLQGYYFSKPLPPSEFQHKQDEPVKPGSSILF